MGDESVTFTFFITPSIFSFNYYRPISCYDQINKFHPIPTIEKALITSKRYKMDGKIMYEHEKKTMVALSSDHVISGLKRPLRPKSTTAFNRRSKKCVNFEWCMYDKNSVGLLNTNRKPW
jgi:hypothetical protein